MGVLYEIYSVIILTRESAHDDGFGLILYSFVSYIKAIFKVDTGVELLPYNPRKASDIVSIPTLLVLLPASSVVEHRRITELVRLKDTPRY